MATHSHNLPTFLIEKEENRAFFQSNPLTGNSFFKIFKLKNSRIESDKETLEIECSLHRAFAHLHKAKKEIPKDEKSETTCILSLVEGEHKQKIIQSFCLTSKNIIIPFEFKFK